MLWKEFKVCSILFCYIYVLVYWSKLYFSHHCHPPPPPPFPHASCIPIGDQQVLDDGQFCNSNFVPVPMVENQAADADVQNGHPEVPSQSAPAGSKIRVYKCKRHNCQAEFLSTVNLNRHDQVHAKDLKMKMVMLPLLIAASCCLPIFELVFYFCQLSWHLFADVFLGFFQ